MFYKYEIKNINGEDFLYLYLTMKYEFSKELTYQDDAKLRSVARNFLKTNNIKFSGKNIFLVVDGIVVKKLNLTEDINRHICSPLYNSNNFLINIRLDDNSLCEITLREYLLSLLLSKYLDNLHDEVFKAICVLYNTYAYKMMRDDNFILATNPFAIYKPSFYYKAALSNYDDVINKLNKIIDSVEGIFLSYKNDYILPFMHYSNSSHTLTNIKYPYLSSVKSLWDITSPYYLEIKDFTYEEINDKLNIHINSDSYINILNDAPKKLKLGNTLFSMEEIKSILNLKSTDVYIIVYHNFIRFITKGWGNSLGLSIFGANEIAFNDGKYYNILNYYFPKTRLCKYIKELS